MQLTSEQQRFARSSGFSDSTATRSYSPAERESGRLAIDERDLLGRLALQLVLRIRRAERVEHCRRRSPVLQADQRGARVVLAAARIFAVGAACLMRRK